MVDDGEPYPIPLGRRLPGDWFPLKYDALLGSRFAATVDPAAGFVGIMLWAESARQDPAGTLPTDERELAFLARQGRDLKGWRKLVEGGALYGWAPRLCVGVDDREGEQVVRLAHPRLTEVIEWSLRAMDRRREASERGSQRALLSRLRSVMRQAGAHAGLTEDESFVEALQLELRSQGRRWTPANVAQAMEIVQVRRDVAPGVVPMARSRDP